MTTIQELETNTDDSFNALYYQLKLHNVKNAAVLVVTFEQDVENLAVAKYEEMMVRVLTASGFLTSLNQDAILKAIHTER